MSKRQRTDEADSVQGGQPSEPVQSEPWLSDGNIVLQAENTQFKVHKSVLGRHSTALSDLLGADLPQPPGEPSVEGCPVVDMQDRSEDIRHMLVALYDRVYNQHGPIPFNVVASMARMGMKYDIKVLRDEALSRLKLEIPATPEKVGEVSTKAASGEVGGTHIAREPRLLHKIVNLAVECDMRTILPTALYLSQLPATYTPPQPFVYPDYLATGKEEEGYLPPSIKCVIASGREALFQRFYHLFAWVGVIGVGCSCRQDIAHTRDRLYQELWIPLPKLEFLFKKWEDLLLIFRRHQGPVWDDEPPVPPPQGLDQILCSQCYRRAEREFKEMQPEIWSDLPGLFGVGSEWEDLKDFGGI